MSDVRKMLEDFKNGVESLNREMPQTIPAFVTFGDTAQKEGVLSQKMKELLAVALSIGRSCDTCIVARTVRALKAGCTRQEILEAAGMALMFTGAPALGSSATLLLQTLDEFEKDFKK